MNASFFRSIRWNVQAWHGAILLLAIGAFCGLAVRFAWNNRLRQLDAEIRSSGRELVFELARSAGGVDERATPPKFDPAKMQAVVERLRAGDFAPPPALAARFANTAAGYSFFILHDNTGRTLLRSANVPAGYPTPVRAGPPPGGDELTTVGHFRESFGMLPEGLGIVFARDIQPDFDARRRLAWTLALAGLGLWAVGLLGGWWLGGRAIQPVENISRTATRIAAGDLAERIDTAGMASELHQLSTVLNTTFERLHAAFERQKQFTADASHELRTPLALVLSETQRILKKERSAEEYQHALQACRDAALRMNRLVEDLLLLARHDGSTPLRVEPANLATIATDTLRHLLPVALARGIGLEHRTAPAPFRGDPAALGIVLTNLLSNAVQHHDKPAGCVRVSTFTTSAGSVCTVEDDGPGIPAADIPHIFERLYRVDRARTSSDHSGLGLSIALTLVEQHGGTLTVESTLGRGAKFTVTLPSRAVA